MRRLSAQLRPQQCSAPQLVDILYCCYSVQFQGLRRGTVLESAFRRILECHQVRPRPYSPRGWRNIQCYREVQRSPSRTYD